MFVKFCFFGFTITSNESKALPFFSMTFGILGDLEGPTSTPWLLFSGTLAVELGDLVVCPVFETTWIEREQWLHLSMQLLLSHSVFPLVQPGSSSKVHNSLHNLNIFILSFKIFINENLISKERLFQFF